MSQRRTQITRLGALLVIAMAAAWVMLSRGAPSEEDVVEAFLEATGIPGAVLAYGPAVGTPVVKAFGVSDPLTGTPMQTDQILPLASLTKPITAAALLSLTVAGQGNLDTPLSEQTSLPGPKDSRALAITPRHLLSHQGGFDRTLSFDPVFSPETMGLDRTKSCHELAQAAWETLPLDHAPGQTTAYSNIGICLLTDLLTANGTRGLEDVLQEQALVSLTGPSGPSWALLDGAWVQVHSSEDDRAWIAGLGAAGGALGRAEDVWQFAAREPAAADASSPAGEVADFYALGWRIWPGPDGRQLTHWGGLSGVFTAMFRFSDGQVVVVLFNAAPPNFSAGFEALYDAFCQARNLACRPKT